MVGKRCRNAKDFVSLIQQKNSPVIVNGLSGNEIEDGYNDLQLLFNSVKPVPDIQKVHSLAVLAVNKVQCKIDSTSIQRITVNF